jgi:hypothetical protein
MKRLIKKNVIFATFKPRTLSAITGALILASIVLKTYGIGDQNSSFCPSNEPQNVLGGTEQGRLVSGINLKTIAMPRTAKESQVQAKNVQVEVPCALPEFLIEKLPNRLLWYLNEIYEFREFIKDYEATMSENYIGVSKHTGEIECHLIDIAELLSLSIAEEVRTRIFDPESRCEFYKRNGGYNG